MDWESNLSSTLCVSSQISIWSSAILTCPKNHINISSRRNIYGIRCDRLVPREQPRSAPALFVIALPGDHY